MNINLIVSSNGNCLDSSSTISTNSNINFLSSYDVSCKFNSTPSSNHLIYGLFQTNSP